MDQQRLGHHTAAQVLPVIPLSPRPTLTRTFSSDTPTLIGVHSFGSLLSTNDIESAKDGQTDTGLKKLRLQRRMLRNLPFSTNASQRVAQQMICIFVAFVVILILVSRFTDNTSWFAVVAFGSLSSVGLLLYAVWSFISLRQNQAYSANLGNTAAVVLLTIPLFTVLYLKLWYPQLNHDVMTTTIDMVDEIEFPSIALFQRKDWSSQANLRGRFSETSGSKCFLGWYNETAPSCHDLPAGSLNNDTQCTCRELWYNNDQVIEDFVWMNTSYRYVAFNSPPWLSTSTPTYMLLLQAFFDYNVQKAKDDSSSYNPSLYVAIYDPALGMQKAFEQGYTRMKLINAYSIVAINIGLRKRQAPDYEPAYDYTLDISSSPVAELPMPCDTSTVLTYQYACHTCLFITIPNFERTTIVRQKRLDWLGVAASLGAYFSLVQFVSWIVSTQAWKV
ncbi:hypothetical protein B0O99DRAFT_691635 [Bisporella sp. PMI_857]|nr:hypothetical protein B0O99DRAFT_691635 [Bisporella sp. PMI_857]